MASGYLTEFSVLSLSHCWEGFLAKLYRWEAEMQRHSVTCSWLPRDWDPGLQGLRLAPYHVAFPGEWCDPCFTERDLRE